MRSCANRRQRPLLGTRTACSFSLKASPEGSDGFRLGLADLLVKHRRVSRLPAPGSVRASISRQSAFRDGCRLHCADKTRRHSNASFSRLLRVEGAQTATSLREPSLQPCPFHDIPQPLYLGLLLLNRLDQDRNQRRVLQTESALVRRDVNHFWDN